MRPIFKTTLAASLAAALLLTGSTIPADAEDAGRLQSVTFDVGTRSERREAAPRRSSTIARDLGRRLGRAGHRPSDLRDRIELPGPRKVFGGDDREPIDDTEAYPWSTVAKVYSTFPDGLEITGSAVIVGESQALTAGHVVYDSRHGGWATDIEVVPGYNLGFAPFGSAFADDVRSFAGWIDDGDYAFDFALLDLDFDVGADTGWMGLAARDDAELLDVLLNTAGYPGDLEDGEGMWYSADFAAAVLPTAIRLNGTFDAAAGQSGSGVWLRESEDRMVVGVVSTETRNFNVAARITGDIFDVLDAWLDGFDGPADLSPTSVSSTLPFDAAPGETGTVTYEIDNFGGREATFEASAVIEDAAGHRETIGSVFVTVGVDQFVTVDVPVTIPITAAVGLRTVLAVVDPGDAIPESDSTNNEAEGPSIAVTALADGEGGEGDFYEPVTIPFKRTGRLVPDGEVRYRFQVTDPTRKLKFRLRRDRFRGFGLVVRPDGTTFLIFNGMRYKWIENQPQVGTWRVIVKNRPDAYRSRRFKLKIKN